MTIQKRWVLLIVVIVLVVCLSPHNNFNIINILHTKPTIRGLDPAAILGDANDQIYASAGDMVHPGELSHQSESSQQDYVDQGKDHASVGSLSVGDAEDNSEAPIADESN